MKTIRRDFAGVAKRLEDKLCADDPPSARRRSEGLMVVMVDRPYFYIHHDHGIGRNTYEEAVEAPRVILTIMRGVRPAPQSVSTAGKYRVTDTWAQNPDTGASRIRGGEKR